MLNNITCFQRITILILDRYLMGGIKYAMLAAAILTSKIYTRILMLPKDRDLFSKRHKSLG
jgi:hypothetical protein